jgi:hypothetical protein
MSVKLEKFLISQRKNLDVESPDDEAIWKGIQTGLHGKATAGMHLLNKSRIAGIRNIAALAFILFSLGYIANDIINNRIHNRRISLSSIDRELGQRESNYRTLVNFKTEEVRAFAGSDNKIIKELFEEIKNLDMNYDQAMIDLKELGPNEKVIHTIFDTYEQKIRLLELIILETNKNNNYENNEKVIL